ncbi:MAG: chorismate lyase [Betaproteobacteria bacterium]|nr:chorismate lyase [Betaproteobacteria bacterium]
MYRELNQRWRWSDVPPVPAGDPLYSWLTERGSLTSRLRAICEEFRVLVHQSRFGRVCPDETFLLSGGNSATAIVRDVSLICDEIPLVFGHSILMTRKSGPLAQSFKQVGNNSLGATLFAYPGIHRSPIYFKRLNRQHALHAKSAAAFGEGTEPFYWARRSVFSLRFEQVCVTEVFSPKLVTFFRSPEK